MATLFAKVAFEKTDCECFLTTRSMSDLWAPKFVSIYPFVKKHLFLSSLFSLIAGLTTRKTKCNNSKMGTATVAINSHLVPRRSEKQSAFPMH